MKTLGFCLIFASLLWKGVFASGDAIPKYNGPSGAYKVYVTYGRAWEYGSSASDSRTDGPMLVITPQVQITSNGKSAASLYYVGNIDMLKVYESTLLTAQAQGKPVTFYFNDKWAFYKNPLEDADNPMSGWQTGFKLIALEVLP